MRARCISFTRPQRFDPRQAYRVEALNITDDGFSSGVRGEDTFRLGHIDVFLGDGPLGSRYALIYNPRHDQTTGKPMEVLVPLEHVTAWEPLPEHMHRELYPHEFDADGALIVPRRRGRPRSISFSSVVDADQAVDPSEPLGAA
jgi:hypothetical protein